MPIMIGTDKLKKLPFGDTPAKKVYIGNDLVWSDNPDMFMLSAYNDSYLYYSKDKCATWTRYDGIYNANNTIRVIPNITYSDGGFFAGNGTGSATSASDAQIANTTDGNDWGKVSKVVGINGGRACYVLNSGAYLWLAVTTQTTSGQALYRSNDNGVTWATCTYPWTGSTGIGQLLYANGTLFAINESTYTLYYSDDLGASWTSVNIGSSTYSNRKIVYDGTQFLLQKVNDSGSYQMYISVTGKSGWATSTWSSSAYFLGFAGGKYYRRASSSLEYSNSINGTWTSYTLASGYTPTSVVYDGSSYYAVTYNTGTQMKSFVSNDGISWTALTTESWRGLNLTYSVDGGTL